MTLSGIMCSCLACSPRRRFVSSYLGGGSTWSRGTNEQSDCLRFGRLSERGAVFGGEKGKKKYIFFFDPELLRLARLELDVWPSWSNRGVKKKTVRLNDWEQLMHVVLVDLRLSHRSALHAIAPVIPLRITLDTHSSHLCNIHERHGDRLTLRFALSCV